MRKMISQLNRPISIAPLVVFRVLFGFIMLVSVIRFALNGWIKSLYIEPQFYFTFYGFEWVKPLGAPGMYAVFTLMGVACLAIMLGYKYRLAAVVFFMSFTYVELIDKTNYLNHYYFISIISFLMILLPANRSFSLDAWLSPQLKADKVPAWTIRAIMLQLALVYLYAGAAKLNPDWLLNAMPLKIWLPANAHLPLIGDFLDHPWAPYLFSWAGALYDLTIVFFLLLNRTRIWAYATVVIFHLTTALLFQIGMFPYIMILATLIFFPAIFHERFIVVLRRLLTRISSIEPQLSTQKSAKIFSLHPAVGRCIGVILVFHFALQLLIPLRSHLYPGDLFWTEQGYRFSWRVMLMEKAGYAIFHVTDPISGRSWEVANWKHLTTSQEKMMATQPDMILQFAHYLEKQYQDQGINDVVITTECYVTLNGQRSRLFINPLVDLTEIKEGFLHKSWVLPMTSTPDKPLQTYLDG